MNREDKMCIMAVVIIILMMASAIAYNAHLSNEASKSNREKRDNVGFGETYETANGRKFTADAMKIHYTASYSYREGMVFATTYADVATDPSIPRSTFFEGPGDKDGDGEPDDEPLLVEFGAGNDLPEEVMNRLEGMQKGQSVEFSIPPEEAYGEDSPDLVRTIPLVDEVDIYETITEAEFDEVYPNQFKEVGVSFTHGFWGWKVTIAEVEPGNITLRNEPEVPFTVTTLPWEVTADKLFADRNTIRITHHPAGDIVGRYVDLELLMLYDFDLFNDVEALKGELKQLKHSNTDGLVVSVTDGIELDFNREMNGEWVTFEIYVVSMEIKPV